jgi:hypothetical protein
VAELVSNPLSPVRYLEAWGSSSVSLELDEEELEDGGCCGRGFMNGIIIWRPAASAYEKKSNQPPSLRCD